MEDPCAGIRGCRRRYSYFGKGHVEELIVVTQDWQLQDLRRSNMAPAPSTPAMVEANLGVYENRGPLKNGPQIVGLKGPQEHTPISETTNLNLVSVSEFTCDFACS